MHYEHERRITRHILFKAGYKHPIPTYEDRLRLLKLDTLEIRRNKFDLIFYSKIINNEVQIDERNKPKQIHQFHTRNRNKRAYVQFAKLNVCTNSFFVRVPKIYLKLLTQITNANNSEVLRSYINSKNVEIPSYKLTN